jgi:hypothetical protein
MTTVGYGDIRANSTWEALYISGALIFACGFFSYSFGLIGSIIQEFNRKESEFSDEL